MQQQQLNYYCPQDELDEDLTIDFKKIFFSIWSRKEIIAKVFVSVFVFFILLTFITPKKYLVDADLYVNKANSTNLADINPYIIEELGAGGMAALMGANASLNNELELMKSPLVIDKVIRENNIIIKKRWGIIPNKREGEYVSAAAFVKKNITFENKKNTNVITISYKSKNKDLAYGVVSSIIKNYIELHKEIHTEKAKSDKQILETEYNKAKADLNKKIKEVSGLPSNALAGTGNLATISAFSKSAQRAMYNVQSQYAAGERSKLALTEDAAKVSELSSKLEWAKLVDEMSDTSKVLILKEPKQLRDFEQASPKLMMNMLLGLVLGALASLIALIYIEISDKKLAYSMLGDEIVYDINKDFADLKLTLLAKNNERISVISFEALDNDIIEKFKEFKNIKFIKPEITEEFMKAVNNSDSSVIIASIGNTDSKLFKQVKEFLKQINKPIIKEVLV